MNTINYVLTWVGIGVGYAVACALIAGGGYLYIVFGENPVNPLAKTCRYLGGALIVIGIILGTLNIGKTIGAEDCEANRKSDALNAQIVQLKKEATVKDAASELSAKQAQGLASDNNDKQSKIGGYQVSVGKLSAALAACRLPSDDDDSRLRNIVGADSKNP
jgi:hypothetical protein